MSMDAFTAPAQPAYSLEPTLFFRHKRRLRALLIEGQPWFVVHDLARLMNASLEERIGRNLDTDQVCRRFILDDQGLVEELELVSESGLYASLIYFHHPENRCIRQWITLTVVPSLRAVSNAATEKPRRRLLRWERQQLSVLDWQGQVWVPMPELPQALNLS
jgi:prophage antirepressor-like protein